MVSVSAAVVVAALLRLRAKVPVIQVRAPVVEVVELKVLRVLQVAYRALVVQAALGNFRKRATLSGLRGSVASWKSR
jgi:hypothetical protein